MAELPLLMNCYECDAFISANILLCKYCGHDNNLIESEKYIPVPYPELINSINAAFFKLEGFIDGPLRVYQYFGFAEAFKSLFVKTRLPENYTPENVNRISKYWDITEQLRVDFDKSEFSNGYAWQNEDFKNDCRELDYVNWSLLHEFLSFISTEDKIKFNQKVSISSIISQIDDCEPDFGIKKG
ncbi:MAG TPA: hypothetical protein VGB63_11005, partial [Pedobacter sp.]